MAQAAPLPLTPSPLEPPAAFLTRAHEPFMGRRWVGATCCHLCGGPLGDVCVAHVLKQRGDQPEALQLYHADCEQRMLEAAELQRIEALGTTRPELLSQPTLNRLVADWHADGLRLRPALLYHGGQPVWPSARLVFERLRVTDEGVSPLALATNRPDFGTAVLSGHGAVPAALKRGSAGWHTDCWSLDHGAGWLAVVRPSMERAAACQPLTTEQLHKRVFGAAEREATAKHLLRLDIPFAEGDYFYSGVDSAAAQPHLLLRCGYLEPDASRLLLCGQQVWRVTNCTRVHQLVSTVAESLPFSPPPELRCEPLHTVRA